MKTQFVKAGEVVEKGEMLALQLERSRRELDVCRRQLAQMNDLFDAHKRSEALLQGEKNLTQMIARGDSLEAMLEGSCRLVEEGLPGSLAIILLLDGKRLRRGVARGQVEALIYSLDVLATASEPKKFLGKMLS